MKRIMIMMAALIAVAGCKGVTDPIVTYTLDSVIPLSPNQSECTKQCDVEYKLALEAAQVEHKRIMDEVCWPLPWSLEAPCRAEEHERYRLAKLAIYEVRKTCKRTCWYNEGSGNGGK